jgi:hypothetical protein
MSIRASFAMAKSSYLVVARDPALLIFPILSGIAGLLVLASFVAAVIATGDAPPPTDMVEGTWQDHLVLIEASLFCLASYLCVVFFNVALLISTQAALEGRGARLGEGLAGASRRLGAIVGWSLLGAGVGVALRAAEGSSQRVAAVMSAVFGITFTALSFFVLPVLVVEGLGPFAALRRSKELLEESWLDAFIGHVSLGWFGLVAMLPVAALAYLVWITPGLEETRLVAAAVIVVGGFAVTAAMSSAADTIFKLLLYRRAAGESPPGELAGLATTLDG